MCVGGGGGGRGLQGGCYVGYQSTIHIASSSEKCHVNILHFTGCLYRSPQAIDSGITAEVYLAAVGSPFLPTRDANIHHLLCLEKQPLQSTVFGPVRVLYGNL